MHSPDSLSTCTLRLSMFAGGEHPCGNASGFLITCRGQFFIATNWHVVTGKNPKTGATKSANPRTLRIFHRCIDHSQYHYGIRPVDEPLYTSEGVARWVEHDQRNLSRFEDPNLAIDVAVLPLSQTDGCVLSAYHWDSLVRQPHVEVGSEVSIIGYPLHKMGVLNYPIWKTGHIASDFAAHPDQKHFLVDSVTREGMSGSPVVVRNRGGQLLGIYSGRLQDDPEFGIGIVWRWILIHELLEKHFGQRLFR